MTQSTFEHLIEEVEDIQLHGWDFSWLNARTREEPLPWDYRAIVLELKLQAKAMLDIGTGGGEFLASLAPLPPFTCATEGYPPNVIIAQERLTPIGVEVKDVSQDETHLPFASDLFDLIIDRHTGAPAGELARVLKPGGRYITQQVGGKNCIDLNEFLQGDQAFYQYADCTLESMVQELQNAGFEILQAREAQPAWTFFDIAGVVFYLKAIPWQIADFSVSKYWDKLYDIHQVIQREGGYTIREHRFLIDAVYP